MVVSKYLILNTELVTNLSDEFTRRTFQYRDIVELEVAAFFDLCFRSVAFFYQIHQIKTVYKRVMTFLSTERLKVKLTAQHDLAV